MHARGLGLGLEFRDQSHAGPASTFAFTLPTTAPNSIRAYTYEFLMGGQEYEAGYGIYTDYAIHADADSDGGVFYRNGKVVARKAVASTLTLGLGKILSSENMNIRNATVMLDALGTAAGSAGAQGNWLKGFSLEIKSGWMAKPLPPDARRWTLPTRCFTISN